MGASGPRTSELAGPSSRFGGVLTARRRALGFGIALVVGPLLLWLLSAVHDPRTIAVEVLAFQLLVVVVALVGGIWPALLAALLSGAVLDFFFIEPHFAVAVADPVHLLVLLLHVVIAVLVSYVVGRAERQTQNARRAAAESALLRDVAGSVLRGQDAVQALLDRTREAFGLTWIRLLDGETVIAESGEPGQGESSPGDPDPSDPDPRRSSPVAPSPGEPMRTLPVDGSALLQYRGADPTASERRLLAVVATQLGAVLERRRLEEVASEIEPIAASDRVRGALLSALSHDLRRPLAAATTAVGGLRAAGDELSDADARELLETADESLRSLTELVTDLLDVSRLQAGVLSIAAVPIDLLDVIEPAVDECGADSVAVELALGHGEVQALADPVLLQRALANLLANAIRFSPEGTPVRIATSVLGDRVEIRVIDRGPGVPADRAHEIFVPFQRLGDTDNTTGLGLGLALSRGFVEAMRGALEPEATPGGGLTMVVSLQRPEPEAVPTSVSTSVARPMPRSGAPSTPVESVKEES